MRKILICQKRFLDEDKKEYSLNYALLIRSGEFGKVYGVEIELYDDETFVEKDLLQGLSEKREEVEKFIRILWTGTALPVELSALGDDFIGAKEWLGDQGTTLVAS